MPPRNRRQGSPGSPGAGDTAVPRTPRAINFAGLASPNALRRAWDQPARAPVLARSTPQPCGGAAARRCIECRMCALGGSRRAVFVAEPHVVIAVGGARGLCPPAAVRLGWAGPLVPPARSSMASPACAAAAWCRDCEIDPREACWRHANSRARGRRRAHDDPGWLAGWLGLGCISPTAASQLLVARRPHTTCVRARFLSFQRSAMCCPQHRASQPRSRLLPNACVPPRVARSGAGAAAPPLQPLAALVAGGGRCACELVCRCRRSRRALSRCP